jgi:hypothetical protein
LLNRKLEKAEAEVIRLRLRIDGRPVPYYTVLKEHFPQKLEKFVPSNHLCVCNICCKDLETIKQSAVKEALLAKVESNA